MVANTLPKLLRERYEKYYGSKVALRRKDLGIWKNYTWKDCYEIVKYFSLSLIDLGLKRQDKVTIIGDNDPEYYWAEIAIQAAGGIMVGVFTDVSSKELKYYLQHSDSRFAFVHDQEQVDKIIESKDELPLLEKVIYWDDKGLWNYTQPYLMSFESALEMGRKLDKRLPGLFEHNLESTEEEDIAVFCYTSGTGGVPKAAMISHRMLINASTVWHSVDPFYEDDDYVSFIPPAWMVEQVIGVTGLLSKGVRVNFPENPDTVQQGLREIGPSIVFYSARIWENLVSTVQASMADATLLKRSVFNYFLTISNKIISLRERNQKPSFFLKFLNRLGDFWVFRPLRDNLGLTKVHSPYTAGGYLSPDTAKFFYALGIKLMQVYGLTEIVPITVQTSSDKDIKCETLGQLVPGMEMKVLDDGQMIFKSEKCTFSGYYKDPKKTEEIIRHGWIYTGDAGYLKEDGYVIYYDRVKDMMQLASGTKYSPSYIEGRLKFSPYILDAMVIGTNRPFLSATIIIDFRILSKWAESRKIAYTTFSDLSQRSEVYDLIQKEIISVNKTLPDEVKIKKFFALPKELDPDEDELTRTRKMKRSVIERRYANLIEASYEGLVEVFLDIDITYEDGRKGTLRNPVSIRTI